MLLKVLEMWWTYGTDFGKLSWCTWDLWQGYFQQNTQIVLESSNFNVQYSGRIWIASPTIYKLLLLLLRQLSNFKIGKQHCY